MRYRYPLNGKDLSLDTVACIGCGRCMEVCPHAVFSQETSTGIAFIAQKEACMACGACALNCPAGAINVHRGVGCAAAIINKLIGRKGACSCDQNYNCC